MNRTFDLKQKEVINMSDGRRLGFAQDVEFDLAEGKIISIIIPVGGGKLFGFNSRENEIIVPWKDVKKIGEDIILVDIDSRDIRRYFD